MYDGSTIWTSECIPSTVRVNDLLIPQCIDRIPLAFIGSAGADSDSLLGAVSKYNNAFTSAIVFCGFGKSLCNLRKIRWFRKAVSLCPSLRFRLISDEIVDVRKNLLELLAVELSDEGSREVQDEDLVKLSP